MPNQFEKALETANSNYNQRLLIGYCPGDVQKRVDSKTQFSPSSGRRAACWTGSDSDWSVWTRFFCTSPTWMWRWRPTLISTIRVAFSAAPFRQCYIINLSAWKENSRLSRFYIRPAGRLCAWQSFVKNCVSYSIRFESRREFQYKLLPVYVMT